MDGNTNDGGGEFFRRVNVRYDSLSATNRKIADYVTTRYDEVIFASAAELAAQLDTSEAAIVRFAQSLGYAGFPDLKRELIRHYREQTSPAEKLERYLDSLSPDDEFYSHVVEREIEYLRGSVPTVDGVTFHQAIRRICDAQHRYVYASGVNAALADYLSFRLNRFRLKTTAETDAGKTIFEKFTHLTTNDVVINYSFYQPSREHEILMDFLHKRHIPNVLVTDTNVPPMVRDADLVLYARRGPFGVFHSLIVPMAITNAIVAAVAETLGPAAIEALQELSDIRRNYEHSGIRSVRNLGKKGDTTDGIRS